jgi:hypothetical protein
MSPQRIDTPFGNTEILLEADISNVAYNVTGNKLALVLCIMGVLFSI